MSLKIPKWSFLAPGGILTAQGKSISGEHVSLRRAMKSCKKLAITFALILFAGGGIMQTHAVPAFARQTGMACSNCHYQNFPALNSFGRAFKNQGYTLIGSQEKIEDDGLSLPSTLNASLVTKIRYQKTNGSDKTEATNTGEVQFPDEAALLIGGRAGEHVGYLLELATFGTANTGSGELRNATANLTTGEVTGSADTGNGDVSFFASFKVPFVYNFANVNWSLIPFTTDSLGAGYGFETLNTGAVRNIRVGEDRNALMALQYLGLGSGAAQGVAFVAAHEYGFINITGWNPVHGNIAPKTVAPYIRAAFTPSIGDWDLGIGGQYYAGSAAYDDQSTAAGNTISYATKGWGIDGQVQGNIYQIPIGFYASYGRVPSGSVLNNPDVVAGQPNDWQAWSAHTQVGVWPGKATLILGYRWADRGTATRHRDTATTIGGTFMIAQNVQLQINHVFRAGNRFESGPGQPKTGDQQTTFMLFSAF